MIGKLSLKIAAAACLVTIGGIANSVMPSLSHTANAANSPSLSTLAGSPPASQITRLLSRGASSLTNPIGASGPTLFTSSRTFVRPSPSLSATNSMSAKSGSKPLGRFSGGVKVSGSTTPKGTRASMQSPFTGGSTSSKVKSSTSGSSSTRTPSPLSSLASANPLSTLGQAMPQISPSALMSGLGSTRSKLGSLTNKLSSLTGLGK